MTRSAWILTGCFAAGCLAVIGYSFVDRAEQAVAGQAPRPLVSPSRAMDTDAATPSQQDAAALRPVDPAQAAAVADQAEGETANASDSVTQWVADATGEDAQARARAISALGGAPKDTALPVLKKVLTGGDPEVDRPLALASLRTLAMEQGDEDGRIKDTLRQTVSHADSETLVQAAQTVLDEVP